MLGSLVALRADAGSTRLTDLTGGLMRLRELDVSRTDIASFAPLAALPSLGVLVANNCTGRPAAAPLLEHPSLTRVLLDGTDVDDDGFDPVRAARLAALRGSSGIAGNPRPVF